jgi:hypothetical protein
VQLSVSADVVSSDDDWLKTSPLNVRRIGGVTMAGKLALASAPVTQEPYKNRACEDSRAHCFCHAKYTQVSQTLWRDLPLERLFENIWIMAAEPDISS